MEPQSPVRLLRTQPAYQHEGFTSRDLIDLHYHHAAIAQAGFRCVISRERPIAGQPHDLLRLLKGSDPWSTWSFARWQDELLAWRSADSADLGAFPSMALALTAALQAPPYARHRSGGRLRACAGAARQDATARA